MNEANADEHLWRSLAERAAAQFGTPCYLSRWEPVTRMVDVQESRFDHIAVRSWLSFKTHPVPQLAAEWIRSGRGVEVVSEAELVAVRGLGCPTAQLLVNGVAKHAWLMRHPVRELRVHFDSMLEITSLLPLAMAHSWRLGLRCHVPGEHDARDSRFGGQFGLSAEEFLAAHALILAAGGVIEGVHFHLGQSARPAGAYAAAVEYVVALCLQAGLSPRYIDCGGGVDAADDAVAALDDLAGAVDRAATHLRDLTELWLENGRYLTRSSAALIARVLDVKIRDECRYLICDGGRTNHALAADNGVHQILVLPDRTGPPVLTTIVGPTCMTDDKLARVALPDSIRPGDCIVWLDAGAYHLPWETRFSHGLCAVIWADANETLSLARSRETTEQWSYLWTATEQQDRN